METIKYDFEKDNLTLYKPKKMEEVEKCIEEIMERNKKTLPKNKKAKILIKPNFNNDLNGLTGNSSDLRIIISVIKSLKKRKYQNLTLADGPNCGVNHIGIDVFSRLCLKEIAKKFKIKLINLNKSEGKEIRLTTSKSIISKLCLEADFIINIPKIKTHMEAGITVSCKNYIGCFLGTDKRRMHDNLAANIIKLNEIIKTDLIIVDGLICMEGNGPGDGISKKVGIILEGHNPYTLDFLCSKLMGLNYKKIEFLKLAIKKGYISNKDEEKLKKIAPIAKFLPAKKTVFGKIFLNNFFIGIRFLKPLQKIFDKGFVPWFLFKLGIRQDIYVHEEKNIKRLYEKPNLNSKEKGEIKKCLEIYCPVKLKNPDDKKCIQCMYCYQILPELIKYEGSLGAFKMQIDRFGKYLRGKWKTN